MMDEKKDRSMSRKEFLEKSSKGLLTIGLLSKTPSGLLDSKPNRKVGSPQTCILGRTGLKMTVVGYGAARTMEPTLVRRAMDSLINFLDPGRCYNNGQNEVMVGKVLKGIRQNVIIQSKISLRSRGLRERLKSAEETKKIRMELEKSLQDSFKALQTDYIDIMLLHSADYVEMVESETIMEFFQTAKKKGQIRAHGFSTHAKDLAAIRAANKDGFWDVIMTSYNHKGSYVHSLSGSYSEWDQPALEVELKKAREYDAGIIAMKTCSAGPYAPHGDEEPSYREALRWVIKHDFIDTAAVAMGNIDEIEEDIKIMV